MKFKYNNRFGKFAMSDKYIYNHTVKRKQPYDKYLESGENRYEKRLKLSCISFVTVFIWL